MALTDRGSSQKFYLRCVRICQFTGYVTWEMDFYRRSGSGFYSPRREKVCVKGENEEYQFYIPSIYGSTDDNLLSFEEIQWCLSRKEAFRLIKEDDATIDPETLDIDLKNGTILENKSQPHAIFLLSLVRGCLFCEECQKMIKEKSQNNKR